MPSAADIVASLVARGWTIATGESLTAGLIAATLADVPGASAVLRGGVVAYDADTKSRLLAVETSALDHGVVSSAVAQGLARGARAALMTDVGVGATGVAGPQGHGGEPVGSVWIAVSTPDTEASRHLNLSGTRAQIRGGTVEACWSLLDELLGEARLRE